VAEWAGLLSRCGVTATVGSNPTLSAINPAPKSQFPVSELRLSCFRGEFGARGCPGNAYGHMRMDATNADRR
jgi:hypothetical protein